MAMSDRYVDVHYSPKILSLRFGIILLGGKGS